MSENFSSSRLRERMTVTEDWEPQLPPVSISMGINETSSGSVAIAASKCSSIAPVTIAESMRTRSQMIRFFAREKTGIFR